MTKYKTGGLLAVRLNSCQIARKSQGFSHVIILAIFVFYRRFLYIPLNSEVKDMDADGGPQKKASIIRELCVFQISLLTKKNQGGKMK